MIGADGGRKGEAGREGENKAMHRDIVSGHSRMAGESWVSVRRQRGQRAGWSVPGAGQGGHLPTRNDCDGPVVELRRGRCCGCRCGIAAMLGTHRHGPSGCRSSCGRPTRRLWVCEAPRRGVPASPTHLSSSGGGRAAGRATARHCRHSKDEAHQARPARHVVPKVANEGLLRQKEGRRGSWAGQQVGDGLWRVNVPFRAGTVTQAAR